MLNYSVCFQVQHLLTLARLVSSLCSQDWHVFSTLSACRLSCLRGDWQHFNSRPIRRGRKHSREAAGLAGLRKGTVELQIADVSASSTSCCQWLRKHTKQHNTVRADSWSKRQPILSLSFLTLKGMGTALSSRPSVESSPKRSSFLNIWLNVWCLSDENVLAETLKATRLCDCYVEKSEIIYFLFTHGGI